jgi:rare lipoprotein A (peptidoglycan hydrolase)
MIGQNHSLHQRVSRFEHGDKVRVQCQGGDDPWLVDCYRSTGTARNRHRSVLSFVLAALFILYTNAPALNSGVLPQVRVPQRATVPSTEIGVASWYGHPYHGRHAANGEIYNMHKLTAAHRTLPFGTRVRVHNLKNARTVEVRITDRGPFVDGRIIDLSRAAAGVLQMRGAGLALVRLEVLPAATALNSPHKIAGLGRTPLDLPGAGAR